MQNRYVLSSLVVVALLASQVGMYWGFDDGYSDWQPTSPVAYHPTTAAEYFEFHLGVLPENMWDSRPAELDQANWKYLGFEDGRFRYVQVVKNLWTDVGMNRTAHKLFNAADDSGTKRAEYVSVHTSLAVDTCAFTSTTLASEVSGSGLDRAQGTFAVNTASGGDVQANITLSFSVTGAVNNINATGLWDASSTGLLFACGQFANTSVVNGDTLQIKHVSDLTQT